MNRFDAYAFFIFEFSVDFTFIYTTLDDRKYTLIREKQSEKMRYDKPR